MSEQYVNLDDTHSEMKPLDAMAFPLTGSALIEASAGTGKTYTIVNLYLRLLLGRGCAPHGVEQILVVTFTNAATAELKERIRQRLRQAYLDFFAGASADPFLHALIDSADDLEQDCRRLSLASRQMDEAAVYTIHSFSQKALTEHAFESGALYDQVFIMDESEWIQLAVEDYWRKHVVPLSDVRLQLVLAIWPKPDSLLSHIRPYIHRDVTIRTAGSPSHMDKLIDSYIQNVQQAKRWWLNQNVAEQLAKAKLNGRAKLSQLAFLANMTELCQSDKVVSYFDNLSWADFTPDKVKQGAKKGSADLSHLDFSLFETLHAQLEQCKQAIVLTMSEAAIVGVKDNLASHKSRLHMLSPDDLLRGLNLALHSDQGASESLANKLRQTYPVALIDEFQDTDPVQFSTFKRIYGQAQARELDSQGAPVELLSNQGASQRVNQVSSQDTESDKALCWIMIGDPKQAIYGFRGADIYTYIEAKAWVNSARQFTLDTNWRSSPSLVASINRLFQDSQKGFLFDSSIPFLPVTAGKPDVRLVVNDQDIPNLHFQHLLSDTSLALKANQAKPQLARHAALQIATWLAYSSQGKANIADQAIMARDICVLVRDRSEAKLIKQALSDAQVDSVFLTRDSVFTTQVAQDLFRLLKALSQPNDEKRLKTALLTELFGLSALALDALFNDDVQWQNLLDKVTLWHQSWQTQGLMHGVNLVLKHFDIEQKLLSQHKDGARRITDLRHLIELLQQQSMQMVGESQLLHWFEANILAPEPNNESQQLRVESDENLVKIITLHASKGLEFPIVFVPFAASFRPANYAVYHNQLHELEVDFTQQDSSLAKADWERLAEDIRLFYVAVTRAVHYCYIGLWNTSLGTSVKKSGFCQSALGSLLLSEASPSEAEVNGSISDAHIQQAIETLIAKCKGTYDSFKALTQQDQVLALDALQNSQIKRPHNSQTLIPHHLTRNVSRTWKLTSYSALSRQQHHIDMPTPGLDEGNDMIVDATFSPADSSQTNEYTPFTFEKGANAGSFLHGVLEDIDFQQPQQLVEAIAEQGPKFAIDSTWFETLQIWLHKVLITQMPLLHSTTEDQGEMKLDSKPQRYVKLIDLAPQQVRVEMEFHMPLQAVEVADFNRVINHFSPHQARQYQFDTLNGMLKGFIDLTFEYQGQFFVADYKSNYLGDTPADYNQANMERGMVDHDYHLQGILYCLALHRWLKHKISDYAYDTHVGGAYYLFLRGMNGDDSSQGVYYFKPHSNLILALDLLFDGSKEVVSAIDAIEKSSPKSVEDDAQSGQLGLW
jgi:exodeoxyribonuclease V beta subunit